MKLQEISFPVFRLKQERPLERDGLVYYVSESFNLDTAESKQTVRLIDDKNLEFDTLSRRRLEIAKAEGVLYPIKYAVYFLGDFVKLNKPGVYWIDSAGKYFQYEKSTRAKLKFYEIENIFPLEAMGAVIQVRGLPQRFKVLFKPSSKIAWAGILDVNKMKILYGLYEQPHKETWRKI